MNVPCIFITRPSKDLVRDYAAAAIERHAARLALAALPRGLHVPVRAAIWAVEDVLDMGCRGLDLGR